MNFFGFFNCFDKNRNAEIFQFLIELGEKKLNRILQKIFAKNLANAVLKSFAGLISFSQKCF